MGWVTNVTLYSRKEDLVHILQASETAGLEERKISAPPGFNPPERRARSTTTALSQPTSMLFLLINNGT